jgi:hypothetical protein
MERKRVPGYITTQSSDNFGLDVKVQRETAPSSGFPPSGDPTPEGQTALAPPDRRFTKTFRDVIPPGQIGSTEANDFSTPGPPQYVDTVQHYTGEQADPSLHGSPAAIRSAGRDGVPFQAFDTFQPRSAPMPRAAQDEGLLEPYGYHAADPLMTDDDSTTNVLGRRNAQRLDLNGPNRDGVAHNQNVQKIWPNSDPLYYNAPEPPPDMSKLKQASNTIAKNEAEKAGGYRKTGR